jgi:predicted ATPase/DNA-binding SARP family transcriptional activator
MPSLRLTLLGPPHVTRADGSAVAFRLRKELAVLAYLAVEGLAAQPRERLLGLLWPDASEESARNNLRVVLANLRYALGTAAPSADRQVVRLALDSGTLDVATFQELLSATRAHQHQRSEPCAECAAQLEQAVELYRGDFLAGFALTDAAAFEEWALLWREALHQQALDALTMLADYYEQVADYAALCRYARRQLGLEPWHEPAQRQLMRGLALAGDRDAALAQYERCRQVLADELGVEPDVETRALYERIRAGHLTPATRNVAASRHNLPALLTPFVGREAELATIAALRAQPDTRLLTLVGAGGMGKTRLALEIARASLEAYADGVFFVGLASLATAAELPSAIAQALDVALHGDPATALLRFLRNKRLLLILDNFEHLLDSAELVVALLHEAPQVQIIATSRARLNVRGEQIYVVQGLEYGAEGSPAAAASSAAVRLFAQAGRRGQPSFQVSEANLSALLRICRLVHGMPLGLELAAAWTEMLPLDEIAQEIERSADFLSADWLDAPERQRSMRGVFDWSWRLLSENERQVLRQLSVFRGGFTREAAEQVVGASLRVLTSLVHKSLLRRADGSAASTGRYELHELLRQFAAEQLDALPGERAAVEARHSMFYLQFVVDRERRLARNQPREAAADIQAELDNVRQAWGLAVAEARVAELEQAAYGWWQFCLLSGLQVEGQRMFGLAVERARNVLDEASTDARTHLQHQRWLSILLAIHADFLWGHIPYDQLAALAREAIALGAASDGVEGETLGYFVLGRALQELGQHQEARAMWERSIQLARTYQQRYPSSELLHEAEWMAYIWLKGMLLFFEDYAGGRACVVEALRICQSLGKLRGEMFSLNTLATVDFYMGDHAAARQGYEQALPIARTLGYGWGEASTQHGLGEVLCLLGEYTLAQTMLAQAAATAHEIDIVYDEIWPVAALVRLHCQLGDAGGACAWRDQLVQSLGRGWVTPDCQAVSLRACAVYALYSGDNQQALADAERAWQISEQFDVPNFRADSAVILGHARARMHQRDLAAAAYQQAVALYIKIGNAAMISEPQAGLAQIALAQGDHVQAHTLVETLLPMLVEHPCAGVHTPFYAYLVCYRVLKATDAPRAATVLQAAQRLLQEYADHITDDALRQSFLENVPTHRELLCAGAGGAAIASASVAC